jgi:serine/threonine-protein phosphatase 2A activator
MIGVLNTWIDEIQPVQQQQRFGNTAFRTWLKRLKTNLDDLVSFISSSVEQRQEIGAYLAEAFGNEVRIDYGKFFEISKFCNKVAFDCEINIGTGHELAFIMFLMCLYKIDVLNEEDSKDCILLLFQEYNN